MKRKDREELIRLLEIYLNETGSASADDLLERLKHRKAGSSKAGRKPKYNDQIRQTILALRQNGSSIREITAVTGCSIGYVQKLLKEHEAGIHTGNT